MPHHSMSSLDLKAPRKCLRECIQNGTWAWYTVVLGTGVVASLANAFPFGSGSLTLKVMTLFFFFFNLVIFVILTAWTFVRFCMFPKLWSKMWRHPAQSLFVCCFPMGAATLINSALVCNQQFGFSGITFVYVLWGLWWIDAVLSFACAFGMFYVMMVIHGHALPKMSLLWLLPVIPLIVSSSTGALLAQALKVDSVAVAIFTMTFSMMMAVIGLSFSVMVMATYFTRLVLHGPPDSMLILSGFISLGPFGQGGFSLLVNGESFSELLPVHLGTSNPSAALTGQIIYTLCLCCAFILWSMGIAWFVLSVSATLGLLRSDKIPFSISYWSLVFPHGVYALLSLQLGKILDSQFFRGFGAVGSVSTLVLWILLFVRTVPAMIDTSIFTAPCMSEEEEEESTVIGYSHKSQPSASQSTVIGYSHKSQPSASQLTVVGYAHKSQPPASQSIV